MCVVGFPVLSEKKLIILVLDHCRFTGALVSNFIRSSFTNAAIIHKDDLQASASASEKLNPHVVLINMDNISANRPGYIFSLRKRFRDGHPMLAYSTQQQPIFRYKQVIYEGINGIITVNENTMDFAQAINDILTQGCYINDSLRVLWMQRSRDITLGIKRGTDALSSRELEIYSRIGQGMTAKEIANLLGISYKTVHTYRERIREKLGLPDSLSLLLHAAHCEKA